MRAAHAQNLTDIVGPNREVLCGAIPELAPLLPKESSSPSSSPLSSPSNSPPSMHPDLGSSLSDMRNRFHSIFLGLMSLVTAERMVTLFIDDVQVCSFFFIYSLFSPSPSSPFFVSFPLALLPLFFGFPSPHFSFLLLLNSLVTFVYCFLAFCFWFYLFIFTVG